MDYLQIQPHLNPAQYAALVKLAQTKSNLADDGASKYIIVGNLSPENVQEAPLAVNASVRMDLPRNLERKLERILGAERGIVRALLRSEIIRQDLASAAKESRTESALQRSAYEETEFWERENDDIDPPDVPEW